MVDAPALVDENLQREKAGGDHMKGLLQDLEYLRHLRAKHTASEYLIPLQFVSIDDRQFYAKTCP
jgi:hypothetical protein